MRQIVISLIEFLRNLWLPILFVFGAIQDPLDIGKVAGLVPQDTTWPFVNAPIMRYAFAFAAAVWLFVWFHRKRLRFEGVVLKQDLPLHNAIWYIARKTRWAASQLPDEDDDWPLEAGHELFRKLAENRLQAFGRKKINGTVDLAFTQIPPDAFNTAQWDAHLMVSKIPPAIVRTSGGDLWHRVHLDRSQVHDVWPNRRLWDRFRKKSPIDRIDALAAPQTYLEIQADQDRNYFRDPHLANVFDA
ncbi:hypothetical protein [Novosphingobium sp. AP12]|uniref:hypothetical protein n=1 Tax=Novosphingobium sp. AP12 TaxID=1144305 RepID=UPI000271EBDD|nr:hypothetical protein [Novosphingobium sp. AP12]EJL35294.1 hypothetical protein PMI02_00125 [Novosphingobium sp. AP12]